jgi:hypothetical protein
MSEITCSAYTRDVGERLFGSAKQVTVWFLLEFDGRWEPEAFRDSSLPAPIRSRLQAALDTIPQSQALLIRQQPHVVPDGTAFFVALARESGPALYEFHLHSDEDWQALDIPAVVAEDAAYAAHRRAEPLFLVCTHGRRDKCCARHGLPVYERLAQHTGGAVWQTSHLGGHRFAANLVALPHGITYGRVTPDRAAAIVDAHRAAQIVPDHYRGRAVMGKPPRPPSIFCAQKPITGIDAFRLVESSRPARTVGRSVCGRRDSRTHTLHLSESSIQTLSSCGDAELTVYAQYHLLGHEVTL